MMVLLLVYVPLSCHEILTVRPPPPTPRSVPQSGRSNAETSAAATAAAAQPVKEGQAVPMTIPFTSGRALAVGYLQVLIDAAAGGGGEGGGGAREGEVTSALHDELAYLLMEGLLVRRRVRVGGWEGWGGNHLRIPGIQRFRGLLRVKCDGDCVLLIRSPRGYDVACLRYSHRFWGLLHVKFGVGCVFLIRSPSGDGIGLACSAGSSTTSGCVEAFVGRWDSARRAHNVWTAHGEYPTFSFFAWMTVSSPVLIVPEGGAGSGSGSRPELEEARFLQEYREGQERSGSGLQTTLAAILAGEWMSRSNSV